MKPIFGSQNFQVPLEPNIDFKDSLKVGNYVRIKRSAFYNSLYRSDKWKDIKCDDAATIVSMSSSSATLQYGNNPPFDDVPLNDIERVGENHLANGDESLYSIFDKHYNNTNNDKKDDHNFAHIINRDIVNELQSQLGFIFEKVQKHISSYEFTKDIRIQDCSRFFGDNNVYSTIIDFVSKNSSFISGLSSKMAQLQRNQQNISVALPLNIGIGFFTLPLMEINKLSFSQLNDILNGIDLSVASLVQSYSSYNMGGNMEVTNRFQPVFRFLANVMEYCIKAPTSDKNNNNSSNSTINLSSTVDSNVELIEWKPNVERMDLMSSLWTEKKKMKKTIMHKYV